MKTLKKWIVCLGSAFLLSLVQFSYADFVNGGFEDTYTPSGGNTHNEITGWTQTGYIFNGTGSSSPTSLVDIDLGAGTEPGGISDIVNGPTQTIQDYFLFGAQPTPTLLLPVTALQSAIINMRSINAPLAKSSSGNIAGWTNLQRQATAFSQQITVQSSDVDPLDHVVHVRLKIAPVINAPAHSPQEQPFFAVQLNNITTGRTGSNPLFFLWNYAGQAGVPWKLLTQAGTNPGGNIAYQYTDWQAVDIAPGNAFVHVGDVIELVVIAAGCSQGGHEGHIYLDDVHTYIPPALWVSAVGPASSTPGNDITYTYHYFNAGETPIDNVQVVANMPQQGNPSPPPAASTTFVSVTTPTTGTSPSCTGTSPVICTMGTLQAGESGTFQLTVNIPGGWATSTGPVNNGNYPISGTGISPLLGPLVQTALVAPSSLSNLVVNVSGLPATGSIESAYSGTYTCTNSPIVTATGNAPGATCDISNLPAGLSVSGCTIGSPGSPWVQPSTIPSDETVTCTVAGTPTAPGTFVANVVSDATNNSNSVDNKANAPITINDAVDIPATLNGSSALTPVTVCCGRPVILGPLPIPGPGPTTYTVTAHTGDLSCHIGQTASQTYLKVFGSTGSCTIVAKKNNVTSNPLTVVAP